MFLKVLKDKKKNNNSNSKTMSVGRASSRIISNIITLVYCSLATLLHCKIPYPCHTSADLLDFVCSVDLFKDFVVNKNSFAPFTREAVHCTVSLKHQSRDISRRLIHNLYHSHLNKRDLNLSELSGGCCHEFRYRATVQTGDLKQLSEV